MYMLKYTIMMNQKPFLSVLLGSIGVTISFIVLMILLFLMSPLIYVGVVLGGIALILGILSITFAEMQRRSGMTKEAKIGLLLGAVAAICSFTVLVFFVFFLALRGLSIDA